MSNACISTVHSVSLDSLAPARLALRANLWLLHLKDPIFSIVVNMFQFFTSFISFSVIRRRSVHAVTFRG
ncbi:MAG: hypothetical protein EBY32_14975 [Proteobacteria bacterium]|nr:hypothetical protein [Pseudomonadota bacterium]